MAEISGISFAGAGLEDRSGAPVVDPTLNGR
jgi:hypothetical protein